MTQLELKEMKPKHAPAQYSHEEADAWAAGYNSATTKLATLLEACSQPQSEHVTDDDLLLTEWIHSVNSNTQWTFGDGGTFTFWTAHYGSWAGDKRIVFRVRIDTTPKVRAHQKEIKYYDRLIRSTYDETAAWINSHCDYNTSNRYTVERIRKI